MKTIVIKDSIGKSRQIEGIRYLMWLGIMLAFLFSISSCEGDKTVCKLHLKWDNAPLATTDSLSDIDAPMPLRLYISYSDEEHDLVVDTLTLEKEKGSSKMELQVTQIGESDLTITSSFSPLYIPLKAEVGRKIKLSIDWQAPWLYTAKGYPEENLRTKLIKSLKKDFKRLQQAEQKDDTLAIKLEKEKIMQVAASYIDKHALEDASENLSKEFFPGWRGAKLFALYTQKDTIARSLEYLHSNYSFYRGYHKEEQLLGLSSPLLDTLNAFVGKEDFSYDKVILLELLPPNSMSSDKHREARYNKRLYADTLQHAFLVVSYPFDAQHQPTVLPYPAIGDSTKASLEALRLGKLEKEKQAEVESLRQRKGTTMATSEGKIKSLQKEIETLRSQGQKQRDKATRLGKLAETWRKEPRRIVLSPYKTGWYRLREFNRIEDLPYFFVLSRNRQIHYSGSSLDSALHTADSLLLDTHRSSGINLYE